MSAPVVTPLQASFEESDASNIPWQCNGSKQIQFYRLESPTATLNFVVPLEPVSRRKPWTEDLKPDCCINFTGVDLGIGRPNLFLHPRAKV